MSAERSIDPTNIDPTNTAQYELWNGAMGQRWAHEADQFDRMIAPFHQALIAAVDARPGQRILDIGCGTGTTTCEFAQHTVDGPVLGYDIAEILLQVARRRAASGGIGNADFQQGDAQIADLRSDSFDLIVSRFGSMFFADPIAAFANLHRMSHDDGRLVIVVWREVRQNKWMMHIIRALAAGRTLPPRAPDAPGPFALADEDRVRSILDQAGWVDPQFTPLEAELFVGETPDDALTRGVSLGDWILEGVDASERASAVDRLRAKYTELAGPDGVRATGAAWLITANASASS